MVKTELDRLQESFKAKIKTIFGEEPEMSFVVFYVQGAPHYFVSGLTEFLPEILGEVLADLVQPEVEDMFLDSLMRAFQRFTCEVSCDDAGRPFVALDWLLRRGYVLDFLFDNLTNELADEIDPNTAREILKGDNNADNRNGEKLPNGDAGPVHVPVREDDKPMSEHKDSIKPNDKGKAGKDSGG